MRKKFFVFPAMVLIIVTMTALLSGCACSKINSDKELPPVPVEKLFFVESNRAMILGESFELVPEFYPLDANQTNLTWSSDDESVVRVDKNGVVYAVGGGNAEVTAVTDNGISAKAYFNVDGSRRYMIITVSRERTDENNIGEEWEYLTKIDGHEIEGPIIVTDGQTLELYAEFTEKDDHPDFGDASVSHVVTYQEFENGFSESFELNVKENGGKNKGKAAHFIVTFSFTPQ